MGAALAAVVMVMGAGPPAVDADGVGALTLEGEASLPEFPCPLPAPPDPPCSGTLTGTVSGEMGGIHIGKAWSATLADVPITAAFSYAGGDCVEGTASGTATILGGSDHVVGTYDKGGPLPRLVTGVSITATFEWARRGATALVLTITSGTVRVDLVDEGLLAVMAGAVGGGEAVFTPDIDPGDAPDCVGLTNRPAITAEVAGTVALADPM